MIDMKKALESAKNEIIKLFGDLVIINLAEKSDLLISGDSKLCDYAKAMNINVFDFKEYVNRTSY